MGYIYALLGLGIFIFAIKFGFAKQIISNAQKTVSNNTNTNNNTPLDAAIDYNSKRYNVPIPLIKAIIENESSFQQYAKNPNDPSYGYMAVMPIVAQEYGIVNDWHKVTQEEINAIYQVDNNIGAGTKLLGKLLSKYSMKTAIEMYNVGETGWKNGRRNSSYVNKVFDDYEKYLME